MFRINGVIQHYPWGTTHAIPSILGTPVTNEPCAEYWLGTHPSGLSFLDDDPKTSLADLIETDPKVLGAASINRFGHHLPFLLKILSANQSLSIQAHPSREQAEAGFAAENAAGIDLASPERTFKDPWPKPEILVALTPFDALIGFRDAKASAQLFAQLDVKSSLESIIGPLSERSGSAALAEVFLDLLSLEQDRQHLINEVVAAAVNVMSDEGELGVFARTAVELDEHFPSDPGILAALLMNRVQLQPGQGIFMPAGRMHAYLRGTGIELQANSDNVLRGGLTKKHIDVDGLIEVVRFSPDSLRVLEPQGEDGFYAYETPAPEFALWMLRPTDGLARAIPASDRGRILLATEGSFTIEDDAATLVLECGQSLFVPAGADVTAMGSGQLFVSAAGV